MLPMSWSTRSNRSSADQTRNCSSGENRPPRWKDCSWNRLEGMTKAQLASDELKNDRRRNRFNATTIQRFNDSAASPPVFSVAHFRNYRQHTDRADALESFLCAAGVRAAVDWQLNFHGPILFPAGIPNPEGRLVRRDFDVHFAIGDRRHGANGAEGHRRPHRLYHSRQT